MELGLSLGDAATASKPFGFMEKSTKLTNKASLGFCMGLSIGQNHTPQEDEDKEKHGNNDHKSDNTNTTTTAEANKRKSLTVDTTDSPIQLDLLPNTPVPRNRNSSPTYVVYDNGTRTPSFL